jgi:hypothetical protein
MGKIHQITRLVIGLEGEDFSAAELAAILESYEKVNIENLAQWFDVE